jgi:hypothetical protein
VFLVRRTFKDVITFIPFVIILLIPLSPIGHVLVFGAIQRFFPDFFPSCFTEQRQNLLQLYETAEYSEVVINENWNVRCFQMFFAILVLVLLPFPFKYRLLTLYLVCPPYVLLLTRQNCHGWQKLLPTLLLMHSVPCFLR